MRTTSRLTTDLAPRFFASAGSSVCSQIGDLEPFADQRSRYCVVGVYRHAAHGDVLALVLAPFGEGDVERRGGLDRVIEEQLVEIAHAEEQQGPGFSCLIDQYCAIIGVAALAGATLSARWETSARPA